jgi:hypothetical protein
MNRTASLLETSKLSMWVTAIFFPGEVPAWAEEVGKAVRPVERKVVEDKDGVIISSYSLSRSGSIEVEEENGDDLGSFRLPFLSPVEEEFDKRFRFDNEGNDKKGVAEI